MRNALTLALLLAPLAADSRAQSGTFNWKDDAGKREMTLSYDGKPVLRYMYPKLDESSLKSKEETFKVYHHLFDPTGERLVTKGVGGLYTHHRGLFYGFNKISYGGKSCDIWHGTKDGYKTVIAFQEHLQVLKSEATPKRGSHTVLIAWHGPEKEVFAEEERTLTVMPPTKDGVLVDFTSTLRSKVDAPIKLDGDPQHAGFHFRADNEVAAKTKDETYYHRPDGKGKPGETRNWAAGKGGPVNLPWNAMSFVLGGKRYTAVYLDSPTNPKEARYSERDYGRFGSYFEYTLTKDKPLTVRYRVWLQEGDITKGRIEDLYREFTTAK